MTSYICLYDNTVVMNDTVIIIQVTLKRCKICHIYMPPRSFHCRICNSLFFVPRFIHRCVHCFDHHCYWLGNCIGVRNHLYFYLFLVNIPYGSDSQLCACIAMVLGLMISAWCVIESFSISYNTVWFLIPWLSIVSAYECEVYPLSFFVSFVVCRMHNCAV